MNQASEPIRVLIADDQTLVRAGFSQLLGRTDDIDIVGEATDGREAVEMARQHRPDVILMDIRMPNLDGIEATKRVVSDPMLESTHVLILTTFDADELVFESLRVGASGFLLKDVEPEALRDAVRVVAAGDALIAPSVTRRLLDQFSDRLSAGDSALLDQLTDREEQVLELVAGGLSNDEIATRLYLSPATVKTHVNRSMTKLGVHDRAGLVIVAYESGLVRPGES
ncbi:MAG: response regulator [Acidimicrobiia bacterium]|nr:response regulator [Acidimicrobiia bacterium]